MADRTPEDIPELASPPELASQAEIESPAELAGRIDKLQAAADDAAGQVRNLYVAFLSFGLYLAITVGATTDEQLLRESPVRLPIVDVGLPLVAFYWIAPLLFVLFHFNLLMQLYLLSEKLHRLDLAIGRLPEDAQRERRATFSQFVFSQMLIGGHHRPLIQMLLQVIAWTTFVILPVAVLLLTQIQFLPYHDPFTTWWQRFLIVLDLLLLWLLWLPAIEPTGRLSRVEPFYWRTWPVFGLLSLSGVSLLIALLVATIPGEFLAGPIDRLIANGGNMGVLNRNLSVREKQLVLQMPEPGLIKSIGEEEALEKYTRGLDLRGRDLRFADLSGADLRKADLRETDLQDANLLDADLQRADLQEADLRDANLWLADLKGADLSGAHLQDASLMGADLQGADLGEADLQRAIFAGADLQGANLADADLRGAMLINADLHGAVLWKANLQGADLGQANLQGADLSGADLRGAGLAGAGLQAAVLWKANLQGAILAGADLRGADLRAGQLWRATIGDELDRNFRWTFTDLRGAGIDPVDLDALIADMRDEIQNVPTRTEVVDRLEFGLRDDQRTEVPSWRGQPEVMFSPGDPIADTLDWAVPTMTEADYDEKLVRFLGNLACGDDGSPALAQGLAWRAVSWRAVSDFYEPDRLLYQRLAQRLTSDDPEACPAAAELPEDLRSDLEQIAARLSSSPADQAEPAPAPPDPPLREPDTPLQGPGTPSQEPQTPQRHE